MKNDKSLVPNMFSVLIFKHIFSNLPLDYWGHLAFYFSACFTLLKIDYQTEKVCSKPCNQNTFDLHKMGMHTKPEVIKLFSCSAELSKKFLMLISIKISRNSAFFRLM